MDYLIINTTSHNSLSFLSANNEREGGMDQFGTQIVLNSSGWSKWLAPAILSSACKMDVKYFPFDTQVKVLSKMEVYFSLINGS